jgi:hypothetical protein
MGCDMSERQIKDFPDYYIHPNGYVISRKYGKEKVLAGSTSKSGYAQVILLNNGKAKLHLIHRLVAEHFIDDSKLHFEVNHIDCNKKNNCVSNLEWVTTKENMRHAVENGLWTSPTDEHYKMMRKNARVNNAKFTLEEADDILEMKDVLKLSVRELARISGVNRSVLNRLVNGTTKHFKNGVLT